MKQWRKRSLAAICVNLWLAGICLGQTIVSSITLSGWVIVTNAPAPPPPPPPLGQATNMTGYFVDYIGGSDSNPGTNAASAWKHVPGDPSATGSAGTATLANGSVVWFKAGTAYKLTGGYNGYYSVGIVPSNNVTYACSSNWGSGATMNFTDGCTTQRYVAFYANGNLVGTTFSNLVFGPIGGSSNAVPADGGLPVASKQGYGIMVNGGNYVNGVTIIGCLFDQLGYYTNVCPMDGNSVGTSDTGPSSTGVYVTGAQGAGLTITNSTFQRGAVGIDLVIEGMMTNVSIVGCQLGQSEIWGIDIAGVSGLVDYLTIHGNTWTDPGHAYSPQYWRGYIDTGEPHQDPIFFRTQSASAGTHNNICGNTWQVATWSNSVFTACIYLEYAASANIYNNLFNIPMAGSGNVLCIYTNTLGNLIITNSNGGGQAPPVQVSYEVNTASVIRVVNNTMIVNSATAPNNNAMFWGVCGGCDNSGGAYLPPYAWPTNGTLQVENNLAYSFSTTGQQGDLLVLGTVTNAYPVAMWTVDYNDWHSAGGATDPYLWWNNAVGFNVNGGLSVERSVGFDAHGLTNDPQFVSLAFSSGTNSTGNICQLQAGSPAIGAGINLASLSNTCPGIDHDIRGVARTNYNGGWTLGAYQY
ncbi:MAG: choice-of-anchor Q domain-containing protein [Verrucomicrobiia bacterium]|jgi:hypothetical protein